MIEGQFKPLQKLQFEQFQDFAVGGIEMTFITSAVSNSTSVTWPTVQAGDVAFVFNMNGGIGTVPTEVVPSGFTRFSTSTVAATARYTASSKILTGSESGSLTLQSGSSDRAVLLLFRGTQPITNLAFSTIGLEGQSGNPSSQTVLSNTEAGPIIVLACATGLAVTTFVTETPNFAAVTSTANNHMKVGHTIYNTVGTTNHTVDMGDVGNANFLNSFFVRCS